ncbi:hypothetical protein GLAREA_06970 [Glarea lozoyensis ATCC 20868]|uniref:Uncharacterized protein n=1 Tax=Glarea lozoyensis (strain ATCC 20868 / MF5171) TaxID=1116229 RepID=S3D661_GLAL2|nr:uncharacterized protein GLAREA_06970 [Glarea lozoyensis ATCC 20868]EPE33957.1 hypothetical protein GLAREA_06970 [Glarea lozoyensis ATCC 20868]
MSRGSNAERRDERLRVPDDDRKYITKTESGKNYIIDQRKPRYDVNEPLSRDATPEHYKKSRKDQKKSSRH